jgi:hypothetical protein
MLHQHTIFSTEANTKLPLALILGTGSSTAQAVDKLHIIRIVHFKGNSSIVSAYHKWIWREDGFDL